MSETYKTGPEIADAIKEGSGVEISKLPRHEAFLWFPRRTAIEVATLLAQLPDPSSLAAIEDGAKRENEQAQVAFERQDLIASLKPTVFRRGQPWPFNDVMVIWDMFDDGDSLVVYAIADRDRAEKKKPGAPLPVPSRYTVSKSAPIFGAENMALDTWIDLIALEWATLGEDINGVEMERERVLEYLRSLPEDYRVRDAAADIEEEVHCIEDDGEDDPDEPDGEEEEEEEEEEEDEAAAKAKDKAPTPATPSPGQAATT